MAARLGIAHSHVRVGDIEAVATRHRTLGFNAAPTGLHPWGTIVFERSALETMGIHDETLADGHALSDLRSGRHKAAALAQREGLAHFVTVGSSDECDDRPAGGKQRTGDATASDHQHRGAPR